MLHNRGFAAASLELSQLENEEGKAKALAAATIELERLFKKDDFKQMKVSTVIHLHLKVHTFAKRKAEHFDGNGNV